MVQFHTQVLSLRENVMLKIENGCIKSIKASTFLKKNKLNFQFCTSEKSKILAECGVGFNPKAKLKGYMLTDEGAFGTMHFGFGSNITVGGLNDVPFHLDFVLKKPTIMVDGNTVIEKENQFFSFMKKYLKMLLFFMKEIIVG